MDDGQSLNLGDRAPANWPDACAPPIGRQQIHLPFSTLALESTGVCIALIGYSSSSHTRAQITERDAVASENRKRSGKL
jgi:hypothetical protein